MKANISPSPSRKKLADRPNCGSQVICAVSTSPAMTCGVIVASIASATTVQPITRWAW